MESLSNRSIMLIAIALVASTIICTAASIPALASGQRLRQYTIISPQGVNSTVTSALIARTSCQLNVTNAFISNISSNLPPSILQGLRTNLTSESNSIALFNSQLQSYQNSNTIKVRDFITTKVNPIFGRLNGDALFYGAKIGAANATKGNATLENLIVTFRNNLKLQSSILKQGYVNCTTTPYMQIAEQKLNSYESDIQVAQNNIAKLSSYGLNTTILNITVLNANTTIITPLSQAITSANNATQLKSAIDSYCLYDGCLNGTNYHFAARFAIAKVNATIIAIMSSDPNATSSDLNAAQSHINNASAELELVGTQIYKKNEGKIIWANITSSTSLIRQAVKPASTQGNGKKT